MLRRGTRINDVKEDSVTERTNAWAATMSGFTHGAVTLAHDFDVVPPVRVGSRRDREHREEALDDVLAPGATRPTPAGHRAKDEEPDPVRTCFERDRDRILHSSSFRRLAGKTQVFVFPEDHQRTRLTHALEVAQVATSVARATGLNVDLAEAIALGHDCGHGPGGHASEDALAPFVDGGYNHAVWGADVALTGLNLCTETLDGIRNHSWSRPTPATPEGEVVSWADRIAYVCHDFEDAVTADIVAGTDLPRVVRERCGELRSQQLGAFITALSESIATTGVISMDTDTADALAQFRAFNYERIYLREESQSQAAAVIGMLRALVEHFAADPALLPTPPDALSNSTPALHAAVSYVAGMTDRFACRSAVNLLSWPIDQLPRGIDR
jgi:dGTPase